MDKAEEVKKALKKRDESKERFLKICSQSKEAYNIYRKNHEEALKLLKSITELEQKNDVA